MKRVILLLMLALLLPALVTAADPGHSATSIAAGTFESGNYVFPAELSVTALLGIGTSTPETQLHVVGNATFTGGNVVQNITNDSLVIIGQVNDSSGGGTGSSLLDPADVLVVGSTAYVLSTADDALVIVDVSDPSAPDILGFINDSERGGTASVLENPSGIAVSGQYAYVTGRDDNGLSIIDISDPTAPVEVGAINDSLTGGTATTLQAAEGIVVRGQYAYVASVLDSGISVIDISDPANPVEIATLIDNSEGGDATGLKSVVNLDTAGSYLYAASQVDDSLAVIDISDPANPIEVGNATDAENGGSASGLDGFYDLDVVGGYVFGVAWSDSSFVIINVTDPTNPVEIAVLNDTSVGGTIPDIATAYGVKVAGDYAYVTSFSDDTVNVFDISNLKNPRLVAAIPVPGNNPDVDVVGTNIFTVSQDADALVIVSFGGTTLPGANIGALKATGVTTTDLVVAEEASIGTSLEVGVGGVRVDGDSAFRGGVFVRGNLTVSGDSDICIEGGNCLSSLGAGSGSLWTNSSGNATYTAGRVGIGTTAPTQALDVVGSFNLSGNFTQVFGSLEEVRALSDAEFNGISSLVVRGNTLYGTAMQGSTGSAGEFFIYDISRPEYPAKIAALDLNDDARDVAISGDFAYVVEEAVSGSRFRVINISNPSNAQIVATLTDASLNNARRIAVQGSWAYIIAQSGGGFVTMDISDPINPKVVGSDATPSTEQDLSVDGDLAYVTGYSGNSVHAYNVSDPRFPSVLGSLTGGQFAGASGIQVRDGMGVVVAESTDTFIVINTTDPTSMGVIGNLTTVNLDAPSRLEWVGDYVYVTTFTNNSVVVVDISDPKNPSQAAYVSSPNLGTATPIAVSGEYVYSGGLVSDTLSVIRQTVTNVPVLEAGAARIGALNVIDQVRIGGGLLLENGLMADGGVQVDGDSAFRGNVFVRGDLNVSSNSDICIEGGNCLSNVGGGAAGIWTNSSNNATYTAGRVGIGTTSPEFDLDVNGTTGLDGITFEDGTTLYRGDAVNPLGWSVATGQVKRTLAAQDGIPKGLAWKPDGTRLYEAGSDSNLIYQWNVSTPWDLSTATFSHSISSRDASIEGIAWKPDGTKMYTAGSGDDRVYEWDVTTPWDISTATHLRNTSANDTWPTGVAFKPDGTKMFVSADTGNLLIEFTLSTPWDLSTAAYAQNISSQDSVPEDLAWRPDGRVLYEVGLNQDRLFEYTVSTPWDLSTAVFSRSAPFNGTSVRAVAFDAEGRKFYELDAAVGSPIYEKDLGISVSGQVGIGTASPSQALTVNGTFNITEPQTSTGILVDGSGNVIITVG